MVDSYQLPKQVQLETNLFDSYIETPQDASSSSAVSLHSGHGSLENDVMVM